MNLQPPLCFYNRRPDWRLDLIPFFIVSVPILSNLVLGSWNDKRPRVHHSLVFYVTTTLTFRLRADDYPHCHHRRSDHNAGVWDRRVTGEHVERRYSQNAGKKH